MSYGNFEKEQKILAKGTNLVQYKPITAGEAVFAPSGPIWNKELGDGASESQGH
jgi:hypothetical protein